MYYRLYKSGFGTMGNFYMVAVAAKSPDDMKKKREANMEKLGDEAKTMMNEIETIFSERETVTGYVRPDLSYLNE